MDKRIEEVLKIPPSYIPPALLFLRYIFIYQRAFFLSQPTYLIGILDELGLAETFAFSHNFTLSPGEVKEVEAPVPKGQVKIVFELNCQVYTNWKLVFVWYKDRECFLSDTEMTSRGLALPHWFVVYDGCKLIMKNTDIVENKVKIWGIAVFMDTKVWEELKGIVFPPYIEEILPRR